MHVTVTQVHVSQSTFHVHRIDRSNDTDSDNLAFLGDAALSLDDWFSTLLKVLVTLRSKAKQIVI
jgi:hypothetical protein